MACKMHGPETRTDRRERPRLHRLAPPAGEELERLLDTLITDPRVIAAILAHLESRAARAPPPTRH